jgi:flagellin
MGESGAFFSVADAQNGNVTQRDTGRDVSALINGALATGDGLAISLNTPSLSLNMTLTAAYANTTGSAKNFDIVGGGVNFQLGPTINATQQVGFGVQSVAASRLGGTSIEGVRYFLDSLKSGQNNAVTGGAQASQRAAMVLDSAITDVSALRGRLGAFERNTIQTNIRSLQIGFENITSSESQIRDTDFAVETAALTRAQILSQAGTSVLATANLTSQNVLALLQQ